ncbi:lysosomal alpha-mannosidase-like isoform X1 [Melanaphis sacchari]|uniref:lysosomal alpha-mannosidase-like isoform X1 n=1 Tax=Melanaphis sacchari TaxID=742174 RepID=UPI000DC12EA6|nr:lysosomal alpha-mannosidase-like isoform X1 [Melanaphis sacchari]
MHYSVDKALLVLIACTSTYALPWRKSEPSAKCGYESCHPVKDGYLNVHFIPHTHDDVGWLKTVDQYYFGTNSSIQLAGVQFILDSVITELAKDPNKRFIYVETAFFWKWWVDQSEETQNIVKDLVASGRLEFIGGAWSMNDEAASNYVSIIDQFTWGLRKLNDTFGECGRPHIGWQIDPFGHSRQMATLFSQFGYDGLFFGRLDYEEKIQRLTNKTAEMIWQSSPNIGSSADLYTQVLYNHYSAPDGFCFDIVCGVNPIVDDIRSPEYNVEAKANYLINYLRYQEKAYQNHGNVILTMGGDFTYQDANYYFKSLDKLIKHINSKQASGSKINAIYSTPSCYLKAVNNQQITFPTKQDDFFPYKSDKHSYWTGYFTSRPTQKYYERKGNNHLQTCKQLAVQSLTGAKYEPKITVLRETMGVMQHHDAISGTEKQHVANDYARLLSEAIEECDDVSYTILSYLATGIETSGYTTCHLLNISQCEVSENNEQFVLTLYNPLSRPITEFVRLPIAAETAYYVVDPWGQNLTVQFVPLPDAVLRIPGRESSATTELVFQAEDLPPLGYKSYLITKQPSSLRTKRSAESETQGPVDVGDRRLGLIIDDSDPKRFVLYVDNEEIPLIQEFLYYKSMVGDNSKDYKRASGAYIFRPDGAPIPLCDSKKKPRRVSGPVVQEIHKECNEWASQVIRKYNGEDNIEFEWLIGPIPDNDKIGKEVISRFHIPFYKNNQTFYTDSNGREMLKRIVNYRPSFNLKENVENVSGNYYPITSRISLTDQHTRFSILNDRSQGGSSLQDGEIELMVHRRIFYDDAFGVGEALNETAFGVGLVARGHHYLTLGSVDKQIAVERLLAQRKLIRPQYFFTKKQNVVSYEELKKSTVLQYSGLKKPLPNNIQLLTLEPWKDGSVLLRFEHIFEYNEDKNLSTPVVLDIQDLFTKFRIVSLKETILGGNQWLSENTKLTWIPENSNSSDTKQPIRPDQTLSDPKHVMLTPMQIRTFVAEIIPNPA